MGLLSVGQPLTWPETKKVADFIKQHGITQFLNIYNSVKNRVGDGLKWGDEVEYHLVEFDHKNKTAKLKLGCEELVEILSEPERQGLDVETLWRPEFASYQSEATPGRPYGGLLAHFNLVEPNMKLRRKQMNELVEKKNLVESNPDKEIRVMSITSFPRLGCRPGFTSPDLPVDSDLHKRNTFTESVFFPEGCINSHPRFKTLANNIRSRRGRKVEIQVPVFIDKNTPTNFPLHDNFIDETKNHDSIKNGQKKNMIYMDSMGFGMGMSCLQMTFQAQNLNEATLLYDQLNALGPIVLALSASCPIFRGHLADIDARWDIICASVDDRTEEERANPTRNPENTAYNTTIRKSRYATIDSYLHETSQFCSDIDEKSFEINQKAYKTLIENGIDEPMAKHIAHLWIRDPISVFANKLDLDDETTSDHFENIQSTNWQSMRFKPPPPNSNIGWRIEFRTTDLQITDFENAAFTCFVVLVTRAVLAGDLRTVMPITKVDENMVFAHKRDAVNSQKFWWRTDKLNPKNSETVEDLKLEKLTLNEIINGNGTNCQGLINRLYSYLADLDLDLATTHNLDAYLNFISKRASGEYITNAKYMRNFVMKHPDYKHDSVISERINYDLLYNLQCISENKIDANVHKMFASIPCRIPYTSGDSFNGFKNLTPGTRRIYGRSESEVVTSSLSVEETIEEETEPVEN